MADRHPAAPATQPDPQRLDAPGASLPAAQVTPPASFYEYPKGLTPANAIKRLPGPQSDGRAGGGARVAPAAANAVPQNTRLGVNFANYYINGPGGGPRAYAAMRDAGARYDRIAFNMYLLQPSRGVYTWDAYDALIADARAANMKLLGVLTAPSVFASTPCPPTTGAEFRTPANLDRAWNDPQNHWAQWVYTTVLRYKDTVDAWEVWNEPNFDVFWCGTPQQFAQMTRVSYQAIKAADPNAIVLSAPMYRGYRIELIARFFEALRDLPDAAANNYYHDVTGFHLYDGGHCNAFDEIEFLKRDYFRPNIGDKPLWNTESGIRQREGEWPEFANEAEAANFVVSNYAYSLYKNVGRYYYWRAIDEGPIVTQANYDYAWGLLQYNGTPRKSYQAFQTVARHLPQQFEWAVRRFGVRFSDNKTDGPVSRITFYNTPLGRVSVLYAITGTAQTYTFAAVLPTVTVVDPAGVLSARQRDGAGNVTFDLPGSTNFRWGKPECQTPGTPVIIIEGDVTPPTATLQTAPLSITAPVTLTWTSTDTLPASGAASGVWWHDVQVSRNDGPWTLLREEVFGNALLFAPSEGGVYRLRVRPRDRAGNVPAWEAMNVVTITARLTPQELSNRAWLPVVRK